MEVDERGQRSWRDALHEYLPFGLFFSGGGWVFVGLVRPDLWFILFGALAIAAGFIVRRVLA